MYKVPNETPPTKQKVNKQFRGASKNRNIPEWTKGKISKS